MKRWTTGFSSAMLYRLLIIFICASSLSGQSLFNRWVGTNPFTGSARSTAMGNTHILNSRGSANARFNPAHFTSMDSQIGFDVQIDRISIFERWSMPMKDSFGNFFTNADYVANEFSYYGFRGGLIVNTDYLNLGGLKFGAHYAPLAHFTYYYSEEVRGTNQIEDGELASKDPIVGYHNLYTDGTLMVSSLGGGIRLNISGGNYLNVGAGINFIQSSNITNRSGVEYLNEDSTYLSTYPDVQQTDIIPEKKFMTLSTILDLGSSFQIAASWESSVKLLTNINDWSFDSTSGLLQYWDNSTYDDSIFYAIKGINYVKPELISLAFNFTADSKQTISISFELNQVNYYKYQILKDYDIYKFGFEYITPMGTPIRGGLVYNTAILPAMIPISMFTFGTGKHMGDLIIDVSGTYYLQSFNYPDLFPVAGDNRPDYDQIRESQFQLQLALTYLF